VGKFALFIRFCTCVLPAAGVPAACPLPAYVTTVLAYLAAGRGPRGAMPLLAGPLLARLRP